MSIFGALVHFQTDADVLRNVLNQLCSPAAVGEWPVEGRSGQFAAVVGHRLADPNAMCGLSEKNTKLILTMCKTMIERP
jgi:hypothetical protein